MRFILLLALAGCGSKAFTTTEQCEALAKGGDQDACWAVVLPPMYRTGRATAEGLTQTRVSDVRVRDYIYLTVTRDVDPGTMRYCEEIQEATMKERCRVLVSRPHLHRELSGQPAQPFQPGDQGIPPAAPGGTGGN